MTVWYAGAYAPAYQTVELYVKLVFYKDHARMHGKQNIK